MADITEAKSALRVRAAEARRTAHAADLKHEAAQAIRRHFHAAVQIPPVSVIGGYWPTGTELDIRPLLVSLYAQGHVCALPVARRGQPLIFHRWRPDDKLVAGSFGILVPDQHTPVVAPDVLLMPLLAFDSLGHRIGYGGGYYDRTIPEMRKRKPLLTVGIAYEAQEVKEVPTDQFDQALDWIVTEKGAHRVERRLFPWLRKFFGT